MVGAGEDGVSVTVTVTGAGIEMPLGRVDMEIRAVPALRAVIMPLETVATPVLLE